MCVCVHARACAYVCVCVCAIAARGARAYTLEAPGGLGGGGGGGLCLPGGAALGWRVDLTVLREGVLVLLLQHCVHAAYLRVCYLFRI